MKVAGRTENRGWTRRAVGAVVGTCALSVMLLGGCVNQDQWDEVRRANATLKAENQMLADQMRQQNDAAEALRRQALAAQAAAEAAQRQVAERDAELARLRGEIEAMDARLRGLDFTGLDPVTDAALQRLAARYPNLLSYDSKRGMLRFASDLTFASGSFELTAEARTAVSELARLLRDTPEAAGYDVSVVGHTDTQPVRAVAGRPFRNNVELSAFRAITVRNELVSGGLAAEKVEFAGFGEFRPAVENTASGNTPANRRVEVFLRPSTFGGLRATPITRPAGATGVPTAPARPGTPPARPRAEPDIMK
jgi:chemotaxis protein MotB